MNVIYSLSEKHIAQLHALYQQEWWTKGRSAEDTKKCVFGSQICIGIVSETDELVGFARVITDYVFKAFIAFHSVASRNSGKRSLGTSACFFAHASLLSVGGKTTPPGFACHPSGGGEFAGLFPSPGGVPEGRGGGGVVKVKAGWLCRKTITPDKLFFTSLSSK